MTSLMMFLTEGNASGVMSFNVYWLEAGCSSSSRYPPSSKDRLSLQLTYASLAVARRG